MRARGDAAVALPHLALADLCVREGLHAAFHGRAFVASSAAPPLLPHRLASRLCSVVVLKVSCAYGFIRPHARPATCSTLRRHEPLQLHHGAPFVPATTSLVCRTRSHVDSDALFTRARRYAHDRRLTRGSVAQSPVKWPCGTPPSACPSKCAAGQALGVRVRARPPARVPSRHRRRDRQVP